MEADSADSLSSRSLPQSAKRTVVRYDATGVQTREDLVATEFALTIYVNGQEMATIVCSPDHMSDLVLGFLASEGVIRSLDQIKSLTIHTHSGTARVETSTTVNFNQEFYNKRYIASCCGKTRQSFYFYNDAHTAKRVEDEMTLSPLQVQNLIDRMEVEAELFHETGGVHVAGLGGGGVKVGSEGGDEVGSVGVGGPNQFFISRTDIGRHNALDKLYGYALRQQLPLAGKAVTFSGRLSSEVVLKVAKLGVGIVLARSAPTALALDIADELNITAVGFVRNGSFNVYTHPRRIGMEL